MNCEGKAFGIRAVFPISPPAKGLASGLWAVWDKVWAENREKLGFFFSSANSCYTKEAILGCVPAGLPLVLDP
jgi:hypothetical protein